MEKIEKDGITYYRLYCSCPKCGAAGRFARNHYWKYQHDLGDIYIGDNACLYCPSNATLDHITHYEFCCPQCSNTEDYFVRKGDISLLEIEGLLGTLVRQAEILWLRKFLENL